MPSIQKFRMGDQDVDAIEVGFEIKKEDWNEYELTDGGFVRVKTTVTRVYRVIDEQGNPRFNSDGSPMLGVNHKTDVVSRL